MTITEQERETYDIVWQFNEYRVRSPGARHLPAFLDMIQVPRERRGTVLDAGCGGGKGALALRDEGFKVTMCDLSVEGLDPETIESGLPFFQTCLWKPLKPTVGMFDWVYCADVIEHIPPTFAMLVVQRLLECALRGVFISTCFVEENHGVWIGKQLHQTVQGFVDWRDQLNEVGHVKEARDLGLWGLYLVK